MSRTISTNGPVSITTPENYDGMSSVDIEVNVQPKLAELAATVTANGPIDIATPDSFDGISKVEVTVDVAPKLTSFTGSVHNNGIINIDTPEGFDGISSVELSIQTYVTVQSTKELNSIPNLYDGMIAIIGTSGDN
jgi:hypothetical protein